MLILSGIIAYALYGAFPSLNQQNVYLGAILIGMLCSHHFSIDYCYFLNPLWYWKFIL